MEFFIKGSIFLYETNFRNFLGGKILSPEIPCKIGEISPKIGDSLKIGEESQKIGEMSQKSKNAMIESSIIYF